MIFVIVNKNSTYSSNILQSQFLNGNGIVLPETAPKLWNKNDTILPLKTPKVCEYASSNSSFISDKSLKSWKDKGSKVIHNCEE